MGNHGFFNIRIRHTNDLVHSSGSIIKFIKQRKRGVNCKS